MIVSHMWLVEHIDDPDVMILDSRGNYGSFANWIGRRLPLG